ncbi:MAG: relaxase/mobilization nuclease domain-containing protein, partial [Armatimonadota bacterium]
MKAKVSRGGGFRGVLNYVFDTGAAGSESKKKPEIVGGNMSGGSVRELAAEFAAVRQLRPDITRPVWHCSLALPEGERLDGEKWNVVAADFMRHMGFDDATPYVAVRHQDTGKDHIHIVASRVGLDGKVWLGRWEARRAIEATQALEREHGLTLTPGLGARAERRKLTDKEINMAVRTGEEPPRQRLQRLLDEALKDKPTAALLAERLQAAGVTVRANLASTGRMNGFSFEVDGVAFKGSDLGKDYTWNGLQKSGVTYDEARDRAQLERFRPAAAYYREHADAAAGDGRDARGPEPSAGSDLGAGGGGLGAAGDAAREG